MNIYPSVFNGKTTCMCSKIASTTAIILSALGSDSTIIDNVNLCDDTRALIKSLRKFGLKVAELGDDKFKIYGRGINRYEKPISEINVGDSIHTASIILACLSDFPVNITVDGNMDSHNFSELLLPFVKHGVDFSSVFLPIRIISDSFIRTGFNISLNLYDENIMLYMLLFSLMRDEKSEISFLSGRPKSDVENIFKAFNANIEYNNLSTILLPTNKLSCDYIYLHGDITYALTFIFMALFAPDSNIEIDNVYISETERGIFEVLKKSGANISVLAGQNGNGPKNYTIITKYSMINIGELSKEVISNSRSVIPYLIFLACKSYKPAKIDYSHIELNLDELETIESVINYLSMAGANIIHENSIVTVKGSIKPLEPVLSSGISDNLTLSSIKFIVSSMYHKKHISGNSNLLFKEYGGFIKTANELGLNTKEILLGKY